MTDMTGEPATLESDTDAETLVQELRAAREQRATARDAVETVGEADLRDLRDAYRGLVGIFDEHEETAVGSGDFESYMECRMGVQDHVEGLREDLPERDRFEAVAERFDARRLSERDFQWAREHLSPVAELVDRLDERSEAERAASDARRAVTDRLETIEERLAYLEDVQQLGDADLDAPVETLRDPIERYNDRVSEAMDRVRREWPARDLLDWVETTAAYPLVSLRQPPSDLAEYVRNYEAGTEPVNTLLEYAEYSRSKLDHYVDEPMALKRHVATHRTYLNRVDESPLCVSWPPPSAENLRFRTRELIAVVGRVADEETITALREVRDTTRREDYERLRNAARARVELDADERERLRSGEIAAERERLEAEAATLREALEG